MGVQGLWQVIEPAGRPVNIHSLRGKVLAIDVSIWLHQLVKGFRDKDGNPLPNAHLIGVFYRVCKLLNYGIKPLFVFDGGVPVLKMQTIASRKKRRLEAVDKSEESRRKLLTNFLKQQLHLQYGATLPPSLQIDSKMTSISPSKRSKTPSPTKKFVGATSSTAADEKKNNIDEELEAFRLKFASRLTENDEVKSFNSDSSSSSDEYSKGYGMDYSDNFSTIVSSDFESLPLETQHEILFEMTESRKMNSWGKMNKMPQNSQEFSNYQMDRLVKRRFLQKKIQSVQQEMGQRHMHVQNLDELLKMDYNFEDDVKGSQEKGFVFVTKKSPEKKPSVNATELSETDTAPKVLPESILSVEGDWSSSGDDSESKQAPPKTSQNNLTSQPSTSSNVYNQTTFSKTDLEESKQLALAIKLSLMESDGKNDNNSPSCSAKNDSSPSTSEIKINNIETVTPSKNINVSPLKEVVKPVKHTNTTWNINQLENISSCSKFLDVVGFSEKVTSKPLAVSVSKSSQSNSSSSESEDFELVEDEEQEDNSKELSKNDLSELQSTASSSTTVAVVQLKNIDLSKAPEDDMFADIFSSTSPKIEAPIEETKEKVEEDDNLNKWDSDSEDEKLIDLEHQLLLENENKNKDSEKNYDLFTAQNKSKADLQSKNPQPSSSQTIKRTLGNMPLQNNNSRVKMITAEYMQAQEKFNLESDRLHLEKGFQERVATSISDQMSVETQELLSLFGIPYIISPMEAESQCAFLDIACLTDGTITDDSDVWLFGGQRVYKNFYSSGERQIEFYQQADIFKILNLDREKLVLLAMLIGGDYSDGVEGIGPVTALELLTEFSTDSIDLFDTLLKFREWWDDANKAQNKDAPVIKNSKVKEKLKKLKLKPGFPSRAVFEAYMNPTIDCSTDPIRWGNADLDAIRSYTASKFGWNQSKCDSMLLPVLKNRTCQTEQSKQLTLDGFLTKNEIGKSFKRKKGSKRLQMAVQKLKKACPANVELNLSSDSSCSDDDEQEYYLSRKKAPKPDSLPNPVPSSSSIKNTNKVVLPREDPRIPQKVQLETERNRNKQKAIKILQNKKQNNNSKK